MSSKLVLGAGLVGCALGAVHPVPPSPPPIAGLVTFLYYKDLPRAAQFYGKTLGLAAKLDLDWVKMFQVSPTSLVGLVDATSGTHRPAEAKPVMVSLVVEDVDAWYAYLKSQGVEIARPPQDSERSGVRAFGFKDPEGYTLELGDAAESVTVVAASTPVETTSTQIGQNFSAREVVELPIPTSSVNHLALLAPNTVDINTTGLTRGQLLNRVSSPVGGSVGAVGGSRARNNSFNVDGVDNNDPIGTGPQGGVIQDAVAEFSVLKNQVNAEYGQATGGQFNIVTKTGTNEYRGSGFYYHQDRSLNSADVLTQRAIQSGRIGEKPPYDYNRVGATVGGPIIENKLLFFTAAEYEKVEGASTTTSFVGWSRLAEKRRRGSGAGFSSWQLPLGELRGALDRHPADPGGPAGPGPSSARAG